MGLILQYINPTEVLQYQYTGTQGGNLKKDGLNIAVYKSH